MVADGSAEIIDSLNEIPIAAVVGDLETHEIIATNDATAKLVGASRDELVGSNILCRISTEDRRASEAASAAMADGVIDGYQAQRTLIVRGGDKLSVRFWGRRFENADKVYGLWLIVPGAAPSGEVEIVMHPSSVVLAITDHDWQIEYMSSDADLLGLPGSDLRGFPLVGLVHPSVVTEFLAAARRVSSEHLVVTNPTVMRVAHKGFVDLHCLIVRMCEHDPPRLGVVISRKTWPGDDGT